MGFVSEVKRSVSTIGAKAYKHRSDICFFTGTGLTMVGTGLFVRATSKLKDYAREVEEEENRKKLVTKKAVKEFALPVGVSVVGYGAQLYSHQSLKSDYAKVSLALNTVTVAYESLKQRIEEKEGADKAAEIIDGVTMNEESVAFDNVERLFSVIFDAANPNYSEAKGANKAFLRMQEQSYNFKLSNNSKVFLDKVLEELGFEQEANIVRQSCPNAGWPSRWKDGSLNTVSFGLDYPDEATMRFREEIEPCVMLRFNCVPDVYQYI